MALLANHLMLIVILCDSVTLTVLNSVQFDNGNNSLVSGDGVEIGNDTLVGDYWKYYHGTWATCELIGP